MGENEPDLSSSLPWRRSLRASQDRRQALARRRRRAFRVRATTALAVAGLTMAAGGALAQDPGGASAGDTAEETTASVDATTRSGVRAIQRALGLPADGVYGKRTRVAVRRFQRRNDLTVDGVAGPETLRALGLSGSASGEAEGDGDGEARAAPDGAAEPTAGEQPSSEASATLERIAQCESGGDPAAVSADGRYRGKYQFSRETWANLGGSGDPAEASEAEQDRLAAKLLAERGTAPWPACGG